MTPQHLSAVLTKTGCRCITRRQHYTSTTIHLRNHDSNQNNNDHSKTVFVPRSKFPHKHDPKIELKIQKDEKFAHTYLEQDPSRKPYVIHDGPPFANGQIHLGHAINKILKDIAARYAMITGHKVEFITGWDCHGLPIEMQVFKLLEEQQRQSNYGGSLLLESSTSPEQFRAQARQYAKSQIDLQMASFKRMGLLTDWNKRYTTDDPSYVANQLRAFSNLHEQKLVFKDLMPVSWSTINKTTVADADIDYKSDHISKSAYILFEIIDPPFTVGDFPGQPLYSLIWTTTPWTLLENKAIAFNHQETYCIIKAWQDSPNSTKNLLVSLDSSNGVQDLLTRLGYKCELKTYVPGHSLKGLKYKPLLLNSSSFSSESQEENKEPLPFLDADFVEGAKGTGLVHISPNYGHDDFNLFRKYKLPIDKSLVDNSGFYTNEAGSILAGKHIFSDGNQEILNLLDLHQALLLTENTLHSYPYETRTNQPIMTRTSQQIFLDTSRIIPRCLKCLESASIFPETRRRHLINTLNSSPNWCISRQRVWGTPVPVLYEASDIQKTKMITHPAIIEHFCKLLYKKRFMDYWWTSDNNELIPQELLDQCKLPYKSENLIRGMDIFDVWSDSGLSWHTIANSLDDKKSQADLYLEGVDQIRGWFSASSIFSVALRGCLPTKRFFLHGFALDESGRKMSKSRGNVIDPINLFEAYGVDPIRLWAAKTAGYNNDIFVNPKEFKSSIDEMITKIRVTFKYLIGALADHDALDSQLDHTKLEPFDQYYLDKLYRFASTVDEFYKSYRYDLVAKTVHRFIADDFSPIYLTTIKDCLYCDELDSTQRLSCLTVLNYTYNILLRTLYPITPHIVHEAGQYMRSMEPLNEWHDLGYKASWKNDVLHGQFETIIKLRSIIKKLLGSKFDQFRDHDTVLYISDKKLFKQLTKITTANSKLMAELFKSSTFRLSLDEKIQPINDDILECCKQAVSDMSVSDSSDNQQSNTEIMASDILDIVLLSTWVKNSNHVDESRLGGLISINTGNPVKFEISYTKTNNRKCARCRRFTVLNVLDDTNNFYCDRCRIILQKSDYV